VVLQGYPTPPSWVGTLAFGTHFADNDDGTAIEMAFSKKKVEDRKRWLSAYQPGTFLDQSVDNISYKDFVHKVCE
jgi:hypothetical protein